MTQPPGKIKLFPTMPILTEVADEHTADIPTLTEIHTPPEILAKETALDTQASFPLNTSDTSVAPLSDEACQYLAEQVAPHVELLLQTAMRDIQAKLPELIRSALDKEHAARQND